MILAVWLALSVGPFGGKLPTDAEEKKAIPAVCAAICKFGIRERERIYRKPPCYILYQEEDNDPVALASSALRAIGYPVAVLRAEFSKSPHKTDARNITVSIGFNWIDTTTALGEFDSHGPDGSYDRSTIPLHFNGKNWSVVDQRLNVATRQQIVEAAYKHVLIGNGLSDRVDPRTPEYLVFDDQSIPLSQQASNPIIARLQRLHPFTAIREEEDIRQKPDALAISLGAITLLDSDRALMNAYFWLASSKAKSNITGPPRFGMTTIYARKTRGKWIAWIPGDSWAWNE